MAWLEQAFVIFRLEPFSRNSRNEISSGRKIYFYDNGIRNSIIANLNPLSFRTDTGVIWENFLISERMKFLHYEKILCRRYFWRTYGPQEIDYIEERGGQLFAYEFKWSVKKQRYKIPSAFKQSYPDTVVKVITPANFQEFLTSL